MKKNSNTNNVKKNSNTKFYVIIAIIIFIILLITYGMNQTAFHRWWNKVDIEVKGENGKDYDSYHEACNDYDFEAAHKYIDEMEHASKTDRTIGDDDIKEAYLYVFKKEVSYLMTEGDVDDVKILYLIKELPINSWQVDKCCDFVIDMSIMLKKESLCKDVLELFEYEENKDKAKKKYEDALNDGKFEQE